MTEGKRVALKYCGGCNPEFDRVEYYRRIKVVAGDSIEWVTLDDPGLEAVLLIMGCPTACPERTFAVADMNVVSIRDNTGAPEDIVKKLLKERKK
ncbi:MAG TPA: hypothetical protein VLZ07_12050 [Syntrophales bacterium]|nr:hypothetical protein [Syntrophales bacterium]